MLSGKSPDWLRLMTTRATASWPARVSPLDSKYTAPARHFNSGSSSAGTTCACTNSSRLAEVEGVRGVTVTVPSALRTMETGVWSVAADEAEAASVAVNARLEIAIVAAESAVPEANEGSAAKKGANAKTTTATTEAAFNKKN